MIRDTVIFVFGSNLLGHHRAGAALDATQYWDAEYEVGIGHTGQAWAIPTKDEAINTLSLDVINAYVRAFKAYALKHSDLDFQVTAIGCGLAGYKPYHIIPMFWSSSPNIHLPLEWKS